MVRFISFEGGDGSGKTTQVKLLERYLVSKGMACCSTREPGGTMLGRMLRKALLEVGKKEISSPAELFLYLADRAQHVQEVISPAFQQRTIVLCDRFSDSTLAYQGFGRGIDLNLLRRLNRLASCDIVPELTFLLDCPVEVGLSRIRKQVAAGRLSDASAGANTRKGQDRFEREEVEFHERVRQGFLELARSEPDRVCVVDALESIGQVHERIRKVVDAKMKEIP
ncbi:MAG: dTMP kinase [Deltaproteobacteria bacterium]|nr:dTMP kinase [Deltaproteobacteria bacterium]